MDFLNRCIYEEPDMDCLSIDELKTHALRKLDDSTSSYYNGGSGRNEALDGNCAAFKKYRIRPRILRDVSYIDATRDFLQRTRSLPFGVAPTAMHCLAHPEGELATARACDEAAVPMILSSFSTTPIESMTELCTRNANALQLYLFEDREQSALLIEKAKAAGCKAVILTVDTPVLGRRLSEVKNTLALPTHLHEANFEGTDIGEKASTPGHWGGSGYVSPKGPPTYRTHAANPKLCWDTAIPWLRDRCGSTMQVWIKGILTAEDALIAVRYGVDGIIVSNHGGRQLDVAVSTLDALPEIVAAVRGQVSIHLDGGIRCGADIFKAIALGAEFVWIGRPILWGLAYKGQEGVQICLKLLAKELGLCMALAGTTSVSSITPESITRAHGS